MNETKLGLLLPENEYRRDAVHVAIVPVTAGEDLWPGTRVGLLNDNHLMPVVGVTGEIIGVIDPFLQEYVRRGQRCYLCLFPNTVTNLRHVWTHPKLKGNHS